MTVEELLYELEDMPPNAEIRLATQPSWPFEWEISGVVNFINPEREKFIPGTPNFETETDVVYLVEGQQIGYLNELAKEEIGW